MREVTAIAELGKGRAIIFGVDWHVTVSGVSPNDLAKFKPGTRIDLVKLSKQATTDVSE